MEEKQAHYLAQRFFEVELPTLAEHFGQQFFGNLSDRIYLFRDFQLALEHHDLKQIKLQFLSTDHQQLWLEYQYLICEDGHTEFFLSESGEIQELVPLRESAVMQLTWQGRCESPLAYRNQLSLRWQSHEIILPANIEPVIQTEYREIKAHSRLRIQAVARTFSEAMGYGFLNDGERDIYYRHNDVERGILLERGQLVSFFPLITPRGIQARLIIPIEIQDLESQVADHLVADGR